MHIIHDFICSPYYQSESCCATRSRIQHQFQEILLQDTWHRFPLCLLLLRASEQTDLSRDLELLVEAVTTFYGNRGSIEDLLRAALAAHFGGSPEHSRQAVSPLREDCTLTRILSAYFRRDVQMFLSKCISRINSATIQLNQPSNSDPNTTVAKLLLEKMCSSPKLLPNALVRVLRMIHTSYLCEPTTNMDPTYAIAALSNVLFLRLITPALLASSQFEVTATRNTSSTRVAKAFQLLVSEGVQDIRSPLRHFIDAIIVYSPESATPSLPLSVASIPSLTVPPAEDHQTLANQQQQRCLDHDREHVEVIRKAIIRHLATICEQTFAPSAIRVQQYTTLPLLTFLRVALDEA